MVQDNQTTERRGSIRTVVVWDVLDAALAGPPREVVDIGGGTGGSAVRLAEAGHRVSVVDPSPDALAALARRADDAGVAVAGHQGDVAGLVDLVGADSADVVLCHGVLEVVDPAAALAAIRSVLRPGGVLSLLVSQRSAAVLARAMAGHFVQARDLMEGAHPEEGRRGHRFDLGDLRDLLAAAGFSVDSVHGIRVFADHVPARLVDVEPGAAAALVELERAAAQRPEYLPLATQLHLLCS
ncbi:methyltransferase domain-containing protein [Nocardioides sp. GY 10113]|uniref:methyltransferase domain-containing protein n=1 Tax=Nocardioides sp. GY 10113 TaxID=2569761 RepID=UPI0010A7ACD3|nr:methyltransferase domain-containing protein [Nocardioides sp. GY 10113]TIC88653.1 methyltransferase domain-containing protein [Nocardioides sp. GY 10113]